ncbi:phage tail tape measure protein [Paenibacillus zanthoxyli]|uniref:phage tail tape measure protein n=1 Tax=Paenibacillus zanthoxyli TaxID=369399 RepID=UPI000471A494|nr:phage tail tape measure protein [Paenibacillus zanthoxyli]
MAGGIIDSLMYAVGFKFNSKGIDQADGKVKMLTKGVVGMGAALGAAAVGIGVAALNAAGKYESAMNQIQNATGMTAQQMEETKGIAKDLYAANYGESWDDLGQSIASVKQITGMTGGALEGATKNALALRNTFGIEVPESIRTVDTMMKNFGVTSDQAFNLIAQGKQNGLDFSGEMLDSLNEYSNQFVSLGFNANQMFDTLAAGSASGAFNLDKVGDAVKEFNLRARDITNKATLEGFKMLGFDAQKMVATFARGGPAAQQAFTQVVQGIKNVKDPMRQNQIATDLFGTQFEDLQAGVITAMGTVRSQFDMTRDSMGKLNATKFTSIGQVFSFLGRQVEVGFLIPLGEKLLPYLDRFGQWITSHQPQITAFGNAVGDGLGAAINKVGSWIQVALPYLQQFGSFAGQALSQLADKARELWTAIQPVAVMIGEKLVTAAVQLWPQIQSIGTSVGGVANQFYEWEGFLPTITGIAAAVATFKVTMTAITVATKAWAVVTKLQTLWTKRATIAQKLFNLATKANVIGLIVSALIGLGVALVIAYKKSDKFRAFVDGMWSGIKSATMAVLNFFKVTVPRAFVTAFNAVTGFLKRWGFIFLAVIGGPVGLAVGLIIRNWDKVKAVTVAVFTAVWTWLKSVWSGIKSTVSSAASSVWSAVTGAWNKVRSTTASLMTQVWNKIKGIWNSIVSSVKSAGTRMYTAVSDMWGKVKGFLSGINLFEIGRNIIQGLIDGVGSMASSLVSKVEQMGIDFTKKVKGAFGFKASANVSVAPDAVLGGTVVNGSFAKGLPYVPWDGYIAELHKGERVLTADENKAYTPESAPARTSSGGGQTTVSPVISITVQGNADSKTVSSLRATIHDEVLNIIESVLRSSGLEGA